MKPKPISRRHFLKGLAGSMIYLPLLEAMVPNFCFAQSADPRRMIYLCFRNGVHTNSWTPTGTGTSYVLPSLLSPALTSIRGDIIMPLRVRNESGTSGSDGGGDHAREIGTFLTCKRLLKSTSSIRAGISADQVAASLIGNRTPRAALVLNGGRGGEDSGYSSVYNTNLSWLSAQTPASPVSEPRVLFDDLFSVSGQTTEGLKTKRYKLSILDGSIQETNALLAKVGSQDRQKIDEYLTGLRELETKINNGTQTGPVCTMGTRPNSTYVFTDKVRVMMDLMVLALQCDLTRIASYLLHTGSFSIVNAAGDHHGISHYVDDSTYPQKLRSINGWYLDQFAYFINRLKNTTSGGVPLLQNSMVLFGSGLSDSNAHNHDNLPIILAGRAGGAWQVGRSLGTGSSIPIANIHTAMLLQMGVTLDQIRSASGGANGFSDATGPLNLG